MMTLLRWFISLIVAVAAVLFALGNRDDVAFVWSPLHDAVTLPVFVPVLAALLVGFMAGGFVVWLNAAPVRAERRKQRKRITKLEADLRESEARADLNLSVTPGLTRSLTHE
ncbi:MAG: LapA family protein [Alphaproteobacteria bacterium]|nr:LapA family protein [Alphaproteobacteria bacterium]